MDHQCMVTSYLILPAPLCLSFHGRHSNNTRSWTILRWKTTLQAHVYRVKYDSGMAENYDQCELQSVRLLHNYLNKC